MNRTLPAEWAPQDGVLVIWPHAGSDWSDRLEQAETAFAQLAHAIARFTRLIVVCNDETTRSRAGQCLGGGITTVQVPVDDTWARDIAPITVLQDGRPLCIEGNFNGWGGKYTHDRDGRFARGLLETSPFAHLPRERAGLVVEGGAIESDGAGTLLLNRPTLIDPARNPGLDRAATERCLQRHFGATRCLWLDVDPLPGDDTDGHVDTLARFTESGAIACAAPHSPADPGAPVLAALREQLAGFRRADGEPLEILDLPGPAPFTRDCGTPCPATYANFVVLDGAVLVPAYDDDHDTIALERLQGCFPGRTILPVPARLFVQQAGSLHCLTMQWPRGSLAAPGHA